MLLSDLMRCAVVDADGVEVGRVVDALLVQNGPVIGAFGAQPILEGVAIGRRNIALRLGYHRAGVKGPAPLRALLEWLERKARYVEWEQVESVDDVGGIIRIRCRARDLGEPPVT